MVSIGHRCLLVCQIRLIMVSAWALPAKPIAAKSPASIPIRRVRTVLILRLAQTRSGAPLTPVSDDILWRDGK